MPKTEVHSFAGCARCHGEGHENVTFLPFTHPVELDNEPPFTHYAPCPTNGEPIMLQILDIDDPRVRAVESEPFWPEDD